VNKFNLKWLLPCFLISNLSGTTLAQVKAGWILPLMCVFHITLGAAMSWVACTLIGRKSEIVQKFKAPLAVVTMFGNATGLPLALMPVILASAPYVGSQAGAALCVMLYGILNKVGIHTLGPDLIRKSRLDDYTGYDQFRNMPVWKKIAYEPVNISAAIGLAIGLSPLRPIFATGGVLSFVIDGLRQAGSACFPLMTLVLGCNLAFGASSDKISVRTGLTVTLTKLVGMPYIGLLVHRALNARGLLPMDPMIQFILLMQPAMPAAMQVAMCCSSAGKETVKGLGTLLFWQYALSVFTMSGWLAVFLGEVASLTPAVR
jgi:predicted permease